MKKYIAEMLGTMVLVLMGCGTAVSLSCTSANPDRLHPSALVRLLPSDCLLWLWLTLLAVFPAVISIRLLRYLPFRCRDVSVERMPDVYAVSSNRCLYRFSYFVGADIQFRTGRYRSQCLLRKGFFVIGALLAEIVFTFVFVLVVLGTTDAKKGAGNFAGLAIGLSLVLVHLACIRYTGTSVNPARSIAPAIFQGGEALSQLWIFIVGPFIGAALSAGVWKVFADKQA